EHTLVTEKPGDPGKKAWRKAFLQIPFIHRYSNLELSTDDFYPEIFTPRVSSSCS
ncbi:hypothetical protein NPIL_290331, partial [Nephila pilipes]